jgi:hypothetical protein
MITVAQEWATFESAVLSPSAPAIQRSEMRRAFYAGFYGALQAGLRMADESGDDDDLGATMMESLHQECIRFSKDVGAGRA